MPEAFRGGSGFEDAIHGHAILIVPHINFLEKAVDGDGKGQSTILGIK